MQINILHKMKNNIHLCNMVLWAIHVDNTSRTWG